MYNKLKELGRGNYGAVWLAEKEGHLIALKEVELPKVGNPKRDLALREVELLKEISTPTCHRSLSCYYDSQVIGDKLFLEMEYIEGQTLKKFCDEYQNSGLQLRLFKALIAVIADIAEGLRYMHEKGVIHRDVKPENILITAELQPKLIDIGLACTVLKGKDEKVEKCDVLGTKISCCKGYAGTPYFSAPEVLNKEESYFASDVFSLGATIYYCATGGKYLFPGREKMSELQKFLAKGIYPRLSTPNVSLNTLVINMIIKNPLQRLTTTQIINSIKS